MNIWREKRRVGDQKTIIFLFFFSIFFSFSIKNWRIFERLDKCAFAHTSKQDQQKNALSFWFETFYKLRFFLCIVLPQS